MSLAIEIMNPIDYPGWDELLLSTKDYSFFHSSAWSRVLCESYNYKPLYFTIIDQNKLLLLIPLMEVRSLLTGRRGVSLPFSDICEPIISQDTPFEDAIKYIIEYGKGSKWNYIEFRGGNGFSNSVSSSSYFYEHTLNLKKNENQMLSLFRDTTKRNIQKAVSAGIEVKICNSLESIKGYYRLHCITRKRHGLPPQPFYFFRKVFENVIAKDSGLIILAFYKKKNIAGAVYFHLGEKALFKYGASDKNYQNLRPNNLVMWEAIKWYAQQGFKEFSFGRTEPENEGLRQFKSGWGTEERPVKYYRYDIAQDVYLNNCQKESTFYNRLFKKMPVSMLRIFGSLLYKHMA